MRLRVSLVGLCLGQCVSAPVYLSVSFSPPPPFRAEDQTQGLGWGVLCLVLECHTLLLGSFVGTCSL